MLNSPEYRAAIIGVFPKLANDPNFKVTSQPSSDYNCIAWAGLYDNQWWQAYPTNYFFDGVYVTWPNGTPNDMSLKHYIDLFRKFKYFQESQDDLLEIGYLKVALYVLDDQKNKALPLLDRKCTHAARQLSTGIWTSKLGRSFDISHSCPHNIENDDYGIVGIILKRKFP